ncbi:MAG TPA: type II pantothenate kinase [Thermoclostridium sp.]|nr:type II pantothenate kinase [Clostridiaceae bacterium]HOQ75621.1 type II pantothenate kinase [Thermoclostridium sp.]HPU44944.1 type II pantothenate kinase [Thermoclostridium sp.]
MGIIVGIDIGGTSTKIIGYSEGRIISPILVKATDPVASVYGALGRFLNDNGLALADVDKIMITGVGSSYLTERLLGVPTAKVDEFLAIGMGGLFLSGLERAIVVSMGTGTAFVMADHDQVVHLGGTGIGGGTLLGLSNRMLNIRNFDDIIKMAEGGSLDHIDLTIGDISREGVTNLLPDTTASNFGKMSDLATKADVAMGIINLVFQAIGMMSVFATRTEHVKDVVLTGNLTNVPQAKDVFSKLSLLFDVNFIIPENAEFATAVGAAAICANNGQAMEIG